MCFDLMQEEIIAKFTWVGKKLGIVEEKASVEVNESEKVNDPVNDDEKHDSLEDLSVEELQNNVLLNKFRSKYFQNTQKPL